MGALLRTQRVLPSRLMAGKTKGTAMEARTNADKAKLVNAARFFGKKDPSPLSVLRKRLKL